MQRSLRNGPESTTREANRFPRVIAIDWSGAKTGAEKAIWLAEAIDGKLMRLENGRDREEITEHLVVEASRNPAMVVGLDFAFSMPAWFLQERGLDRVRKLWDLAGREAEDWLTRCEPPFWGRPGRGRPALGTGRDHFRRTDSEVPSIGGVRPKSVFQIGGAGAVGTGSLRGMPVLRRLSGAGFSVWPFDPPDWPRVVEIYPRSLTGAVNKSSATERTAYLSSRHGSLGPEVMERAASNEDAFDAAVSALVLAEHLDELTSISAATDPQTLLEGEIWQPRRSCGSSPAISSAPRGRAASKT